MTEWELHITYGLTPFTLKAQLEYQSNQIMRIRVHGSKSSILLECNFPFIVSAKNKKGIQWKMKEGNFVQGGAQNARLLTHIIGELEYNLKKDFRF